MYRVNPNEYSSDEFLQSWEMEIRAGYTAPQELDVLERLAEYLDTSVPPDIEAEISRRALEATEHLLQEERAAELTWTEPTMNDRIASAFEYLRTQGIFSMECFGLTIQDGWARVGLEAPVECRGVVFFHQQDVFDAMRGWTLPLAFGGAGSEVEDPHDAHSIAVVVLDALARFEVPASWSGYVEDRLEVRPFEWRRRRWTTSPRVAPVEVESHRETFPRHSPKRQLELFGPSISEVALDRYKRVVRAYHSCAAFDATLSFVMRGGWERLGGQRGQVGHFGDPHTFVRSGHTTVMVPRDAMTNLAAIDAAALRKRAMGVRDAALAAHSSVPSEAMTASGTSKAKPWWKLW